MMRLWNRSNTNGAQAPLSSHGSGVKAPPNVGISSKRRLRESNSIEDVKEVIKSPKPSAKSKKVDENNPEKRFPNLVHNHEIITNRSHSDTNNNRKGNL